MSATKDKNGSPHTAPLMFRFGKHPAVHDYRTLRFKDYASELPPPQPQFNALQRVYDNLHNSDPGALFPMDGNDTLGDCTIAALAHAATVYGGLTGKSNIMAKQAVVKLYFADESKANEAAEEVRAEGLSATVGRPALGSGWSVMVEGEPSAVLAFAERLRAD